MPKTTVVICIDGLDPDYLESCETPNLSEMGRKGFLRVGSCMMPSVTNVNNVSIVTGGYPEIHGISSNYRLLRETGQEVYMESAEYVQAETMFRRAKAKGMTSVLATAKDKLRTLLGEDTTVAVSSEQPPEWLVEGIGPPPGIYSLEVNGWVIRAASFVMSRRAADVVYISTTDYAMHTYAPDEPMSHRHMSILDSAIGELAAAHPDAAVLITADHGMSAKSRMIDLKGALAARGIGSNPVPVVKDRYVVHHSNLGGCIYVYLESRDVREALKALRDIPGVEEALPCDEAAAKLRLPRDRIGDIVVTGAEEVVFGDPAKVALPPGLRSHGSAHERRVPLIGYNGEFEGLPFEENRDIGRYVIERVLA